MGLTKEKNAYFAKQTESFGKNDGVPLTLFWRKRRYVISILAFFGFFNVYALRVNLSIAIIDMTNTDRYVTLENGSTVNIGPEFPWTNEVKGYVLSAFFYGYMTTQLLGGFFATRWSGKIIFGTGVAVTAIFTLLTPWCATVSVYLFIVVRAIAGIFEGATLPALQAVWAKWAPPHERTRISSIALSGNFIGTVVSMPLDAYLTTSLGWRSVFYFSGALGLVWYVLWMIIVQDTPEQDKSITESEKNYIQESLRVAESNQSDTREVPWKAMLTSKPVWSIIVSNFGEAWGFYTFLTLLPSYLKEMFNFDLGQSGILSGLPYLCMAIVMPVAGYLSDWLIAKGHLTKLKVRKMFNFIGYISQFICITAVAFWDNSVATVILLCMSVGLGGCSFTTFSVNTLDIAPQYASVILGLSNTCGAFSGVISPIIAGYTIDTHNPTRSQWQIVFFITAGIYLFTAIFYIIFASASLQSWAVKKEDTKEPSVAYKVEEMSNVNERGKRTIPNDDPPKYEYDNQTFKMNE